MKELIVWCFITTLIIMPFVYINAKAVETVPVVEVVVTDGELKATPSTPARDFCTLPYVSCADVTLSIEEQIRKIGKERDLPQPVLDRLVRIVYCESRFIIDVRHTNNDIYKSIDRGLCQFNSYWHPEINDACADSVDCSVNAMIDVYEQDGHFGQWACNFLI